MRSTRLPLLAALLLAACGSTAAPPPPIQVYEPGPLIRDRPYEAKVPRGYDGKTPLPLLLLLHGFGASGELQNTYFAMSTYTEQHGVLLALPDGTKTGNNGRAWNATDACCAPNSPVDDVAYLTAVIDDMIAQYNVDPRQVFLVGHSNGGFMSYRMACDRSERIAGIVSLAGLSWKDEGRCRPREPVAVLQIHGDQDDVVDINGGPGAASAEASAGFFARQGGCAAQPTDSGERLDLDRTVPGAETEVRRFGGCARGAAELWVMKGSGHVPIVSQPAWGDALLGFLRKHQKPAP